MPKDPAESYDVSSKYPEALADMKMRVERARATFAPLATPKTR